MYPIHRLCRATKRSNLTDAEPTKVPISSEMCESERCCVPSLRRRDMVQALMSGGGVSDNISVGPFLVGSTPSFFLFPLLFQPIFADWLVQQNLTPLDAICVHLRTIYGARQVLLDILWCERCLAAEFDTLVLHAFQPRLTKLKEMPGAHVDRWQIGVNVSGGRASPGERQ